MFLNSNERYENLTEKLFWEPVTQLHDLPLINPLSELPYLVLEVQFYVSTWKHPSVNQSLISPPF